MVRFLVARGLGRMLPPATRERVFAAAYDDLLGDYLAARRHAPAAFAWRLRATYELRATLMALECWRVLLFERLFPGPRPSAAAPPPNRAPRTGDSMDSFAGDLRYAVRQLTKAPVFTATAVLIVAIGIGANTAAFSVVNAMLLRPQPFERPWELVDIYQDSDDGQPNSSSFPAYRDIAAYEDLFSGVAATFVTSAAVQRGEGLAQVVVEYSTANYMPVLGLRPSIGRWFDASENVTGGETVAVLSYRSWQQMFGADPGVLGTTMRLNGATVTVVGVGPAGYGGYMPLNGTDVWLSLSSLGPVMGAYAGATLEQRGDHWFFVKARLRDGVETTQVQQAMESLADRLEAAFPEHNEGRRITAFGSGEVRMHPEIDVFLSPLAAFLMAIVGLVLLLACSNLANLLLVRAAGRGGEMSIRAALGANRARVARQLLTESLLLSVAGGALGVIVAAWSTRALMGIPLPLPVPIATDLSIDTRVLAFAFLLSLATGVLFGLAPALSASRPDLAAAMRGEPAGTASRRRRLSLRNGLVVVQVAISFVLLFAAGLFIRSLDNAGDVDTGFAVGDVAMLRTNPGFAGYGADEASQVMAELLRRARSLPGIEAAALASVTPVTPRGTTSLVIDGYAPPTGQNSVEVPFTFVGEGYFQTLRIPLLHGRVFNRTDLADGEQVAVISATMARRFWGDADAVGRRFRSEGRPDSWRRVVGVVADTVIRDLTESTGPQVYFSFQQTVPSSGVVFVRSPDAAGALGMLREELRAIDADIPVVDANTMAGHLGDSLALPRAGVRILGAFGVLALALAGLGLYGVVSFAVRRRVLEVGVRVALGARSNQVIALVLRDVAALAGTGLLFGIALALASTVALQSVLFEVSSSDPITLAAVSLLLLAVALGAALVPARHAAHADPVIALRRG